MIKGVLLDFDGVIVDTDLATIRFYNELLREKGLEIREEDYPKKAGRKSHDFFREVMPDKLHLLDLDEMVERKREAFEQNVERYVSEVPGAIEMVDRLHRAGLKLAISSAHGRGTIEAALRHFGIADRFGAVVGFEDVRNKKPHPEAYMRAVEMLGLKPEEVVVVEDSDTGISGALAGGFKVIAPRRHYNKATIGKAHAAIDSLDELTPEAVRRVAAPIAMDEE